MSEAEPEHPKPGWRTWFARFCAVWMAAQFVGAPVRMALQQHRDRGSAALSPTAYVVMSAITATVAFLLVRGAWRAPPRPEDAAPLRRAEGAVYCLLVAAAVFYTADWVFGLGLWSVRR